MLDNEDVVSGGDRNTSAPRADATGSCIRVGSSEWRMPVVSWHGADRRSDSSHEAGVVLAIAKPAAAMASTPRDVASLLADQAAGSSLGDR